VRNTVRALSEMLAEETDRTIADLGRYFTDPSAPRAAPQAVGPTPPEAPPESLVLPDPASPLNQLAQVQRDDTPVPVGRGAVFAPTLSDGDREPRAALYQDGTEIAEGQLGARLVVPPGDYELRVGSGAVSQQVAVKVRVVEGKTTVVPPSWASLDILVVGDTFLPFRGTYELIRMADREELGLGFGADETLGEVTRVWVLAPGLYKIIRAGGTYRDRTNFATVRLEADKLTRFTLVLDKDDGSFHGAGENDPGISDIATTDEEAESKWKLRGLVGGDLNLNRSTMLGAPPGLRLSFRIFLDGSAAWIDGPNVWVTRLELEEGETRLLDRGVFQNDTDRLFLNTIYTHQLLSWFGPYVRFGLETKLLPRNQDFDPPRDVVVLDASGQIVEMRPGVTRVELGSTFAPLQLKEGAGGNFRVLRSTALELNLRVGFGAQQTVANGLYVFEDIAGAPGQLVPVVNSSVTGPEATLVGVGRLSKFITIITELEGLLPVGSDSGVVFTWRNQATLRLISFISLVYRFNMTRNPNLGIGDEARTEHDLQLRFSYVLF